MFILDNKYFDNPDDYLPRENDYYLISFNKTVGDENDKDITYNVSISDFVTRLDGFNEDKISSFSELTPKDTILDLLYCNPQTTDTALLNSISMMSIGPDLDLEEQPDTGHVEDGYSFATAIELETNQPFLDHLYVGQSIYYKYTSTDTYNTKFYSYQSNSDVDLKAELYDENYNLITSDRDSGFDENFLMDHWSRTPKTYYIKVSGDAKLTSGGFSIRVDKDNDCSCVNNTVFLTDYDNSVNNGAITIGDTLISNELSSREKEALNDAINVWNELGEISITYYSGAISYDIRVGSEYKDNDRVGYYLNMFGIADVIYINSYTTRNASHEVLTSVFIHELGHSLGLEHMHNTGANSNESINQSENINNIMNYNAAQDLIVLGPCDKNAYYYLWR